MHHRQRKTFLRLKDFASTHTDVPAVTAWGPFMPADFIEDLQDDIADFQAAITGQAGKVGDRKSAGVMIDQTVDDGMSIKRQMDPIARNFYHDRPGVLAE